MSELYLLKQHIIYMQCITPQSENSWQRNPNLVIIISFYILLYFFYIIAWRINTMYLMGSSSYGNSSMFEVIWVISDSLDLWGIYALYRTHGNVVVWENESSVKQIHILGFFNVWISLIYMYKFIIRIEQCRLHIANTYDTFCYLRWLYVNLNYVDHMKIHLQIHIFKCIFIYSLK